MSDAKAPVLIAGPTASGKSAVAMELARLLDGEIISVDSMQVYRGMDIGTAKPGPEDRRQVAHHLIDMAEPSQPFDAAQFAAAARQSLAQIQSRGHLPIFCGGTGLYFNAFLHGLGGAPQSNPALRAELESTPLEILLAELDQADPETARRIDRQNPRRVIRAMEVIRLTGRPYSQQRACWTDSSATPPAFGLSRDVEDLRNRINRRVDAMFASGLVVETRALLSRGLADNRTALQALGYRQVYEHLHGGPPLEQTIEQVKIKTRQFAKRQMAWFRHQMKIEWIEARPDASPADLAAEIARRLKRTATDGFPAF
jgi:tRNA dimethylallyltransferase